MRHITLIILLFSFTISQSLSQDFEGLYTSEKGDSLWFYPNKKITFKLVKVDGLGGRFIIGEGSYERRKDRIIINSTGHPKKYESSVNRINHNPNVPPPYTKTFTILDTDNNPIGGTHISYQIKPCKFIGVSSDKFGRAELILNESLDTDIRIEFIGYVPAIITTAEGDAEYIVELIKDHISFADIARISIEYSIINGHTLEIRLKKYKKRRKCNWL